MVVPQTKTLVRTALNLEEKMKSYLQAMTFFIKPQIWIFNDVVLQATARKWTKVKTHVQSVQRYCFCPLNMQICDVLVAVSVDVVAKAP